LGELSEDGRRVKVQGQPLQILSILLQRRGDLVTEKSSRPSFGPAIRSLTLNRA
jgi:hypothetical protein